MWFRTFGPACEVVGAKTPTVTSTAKHRDLLIRVTSCYPPEHYRIPFSKRNAGGQHVVARFRPLNHQIPGGNATFEICAVRRITLALIG